MLFREVVRGRGGWRATPSRPTRPHGGKHFRKYIESIGGKGPAHALTRAFQVLGPPVEKDRMSDKQGVAIQLGTWPVSKAELQESVVVPGLAGQRFAPGSIQENGEFGVQT